MSEEGYPIKEPKLKSGGAKDASAYSDKAQSGGAARKGAPLDGKGGVSKKDEAPYKEACKDE